MVDSGAKNPFRPIPSPRGARMRIRRPLTLLLAAVATTVVATAGPAAAAPAATGTAVAAPQVIHLTAAAPAAVVPTAIGTHLHVLSTPFFGRAGVTAQVTWGFDYNPANNNLRAYGQIWTDSGTTHVQFQPLRLGDRNGVLADKNANSQFGLLEVETAAVSCHKPAGVYRSKPYFSIRWPDGVLQDFVIDPPYELGASTICV
jgi:hypothetical protein